MSVDNPVSLKIPLDLVFCAVHSDGTPGRTATWPTGQKLGKSKGASREMEPEDV